MLPSLGTQKKEGALRVTKKNAHVKRFWVLGSAFRGFRVQSSDVTGLVIRVQGIGYSDFTDSSFLCIRGLSIPKGSYVLPFQNFSGFMALLRDRNTPPKQIV